MSIYVTKKADMFIPDHLRITGVTQDHRFPKTQYNGIVVVMVKDEKEVIYNSIASASLITGISGARIRNCIKGKTKNTNGIVWRRGVNK